jgi:transposase-like protein
MATSIKRKSASTDGKKVRQCRTFSQEFKQEAVQMLLDGHSAVSVAERLGLPGPNLLYIAGSAMRCGRPGRQLARLVIGSASSKRSCGASSASETS